MNDLVTENESLIYHVLKQMNLYNQRNEYYDVGAIGLCKASNTFDETKGYTFSTYACFCIKNQILQEIRKSKSKHNKANYGCISLNKTIDNENDYEIQDILPSKVNIEEDYLLKEQIKELKNAILKLKDEEQYIINHTFEIDNCKKLNQIELANDLNISQAQVCRLLKRAIVKLKKEFVN